jgi:hypothetical protein
MLWILARTSPQQQKPGSACHEIARVEQFQCGIRCTSKVKMATVNKQNTCNTLFLRPGAGRMRPGVSIMV